MHLEAVGVLAVAPIVGTHGGFHVGHVPRLGTQHAQEGGRVHRPGANLGIVRLPEHGTALGPEVLQFEDDFLESGFWSHGLLDIVIGIIAWGIIPNRKIKKGKTMII